ncbi:hypothetical protein [Alishewanella longhuensis]
MILDRRLISKTYGKAMVAAMLSIQGTGPILMFDRVCKSGRWYRAHFQP